MSDSVQNLVLLASNNPSKLLELTQLLQPLGWQVVSVNQVPDLADLVPPTETGLTFQANAELKARYYATYWSGAVIADDSGLEVEFLDNQPGVESNRWLAGTDQDRNAGILAKLKSGQAMKVDRRQARYVSVICWLKSKLAKPVFFRGEVIGQIASASAGQAGFGYDPIFIPEGFNQTFAQLGLEIKNQLSHRARAINQLVKFLIT